jgi:formyl-CoA transferase
VDQRDALAGIRVLEVGSLIAGPFAGRLLADFGAEVIKIESPVRADPFRDWGHGQVDGHALWWPVQSRNKKLVTLDLARGRDVFLKLVERSDIMVENFRPGTLERWDLGEKELTAVNPGLVLVRVSGYGQTGPQAGRPGFASVAEAASGLRSINGYPGQPPPRTGISLGDTVGALFATIGALIALLARGRDSQRRGQVVDVSLLEACVSLLESAIPEYDRLGTVRGPSGTRLDGIAPSNLYASRDGHWVVIAANTDGLFRALCQVMGRPGLADNPRFASHTARAQNQDAIDGIVASWAAGADRDQILTALDAAGVVCGPVNTIADVVADPQLLARQALVPHHDEEIGDLLAPGVVPRLSRTPGEVRWSGRWAPGADNDEVYRGLLGMDLEALREEGIV